MSQNKKRWKCPQCGKKTPKDKQFCQHCLYNVGHHHSKWSVHISYKPGWVDTFNRHNPHPEAMDAEGERRATDIMLDARQEEMRYSKKAARWERGRKVAWRRNVAYERVKKKEHRRKVEKAKETAKDFLKSRARARKEK